MATPAEITERLRSTISIPSPELDHPRLPRVSRGKGRLVNIAEVVLASLEARALPCRRGVGEAAARRSICDREHC